MRRALIAAAVTLSVVSCTRATPAIGAFRTTSVILHGSQGPVHVEVQEAASPDEREQGLMGQTSLGTNQGMVFLFGDESDGPVTSQFWMKDTLIPLSVAFVAQDGTIVSMSDMDPCTADPCPTYPASGPFTMAVEANLGWFHDHGVGVGSLARLETVDG
jgi:uncharacterized membrane protein (UPF0127 family)